MEAGFGPGAWAADDPYAEVALACAGAGDVPTIEALATALLQAHLPDLRLCPVNRMAPLPSPRDPDDVRLDVCFGTGRPVVFAFYGHPVSTQELTNRRAAHPGFHGYGEHGATTTPFDMTVWDDIARDGLALDVAACRAMPRSPVGAGRGAR